MNKGIAHQLMTALIGLPGISLYGGLVDVQEQVQSITGEDYVKKNVLLRYPVTADYSPCTVTNPTLKNMTPSGKETGILFFEGGTTVPNGQKAGRLHGYQSRLRLLIWLNTQVLQVTPATSPAPTSGGIHDLPALLINEVAHRLDNLYGKQVGQYSNFRPAISQVHDSDKKLFAAYSFNSTETQYLMPPYLAIGADIAVDYYLHRNCIQNLVVTTVPSC